MTKKQQQIIQQLAEANDLLVRTRIVIDQLNLGSNASKEATKMLSEDISNYTTKYFTDKK